MSASSSVYVACPKLVDTCRPLQASATRSYLQRSASSLMPCAWCAHGLLAQTSACRPSRAHVACLWSGCQNVEPVRI